MGVQMSQIPLASHQQLEAAINQYIAQGYVVAYRTADSATMMKKKEFSILWMVIGLVLCLIPLLIYIVIYAGQNDLMVELRVAQQGELMGVQLSPDGRYWWDGTAWQDSQLVPPSSAPRSPDGAAWWDGTAWRPLPA